MKPRNILWVIYVLLTAWISTVIYQVYPTANKLIIVPALFGFQIAWIVAVLTVDVVFLLRKKT